MEELDQLRQALQDGRLDSERLLDLLVTAQRQLHAAQQQLQAAQQRIAELEKQRDGSTTTKVAEPFSLRAEEKRQQARGKKKKKTKKDKKRRGRLNTADKVAQAERREPVFPAGVDPQDCTLSHVRPVWRVENGRAVLVAYEIYRGPKNR